MNGMLLNTIVHPTLSELIHCNTSSVVLFSKRKTESGNSQWCSWMVEERVVKEIELTDVGVGGESGCNEGVTQMSDAPAFKYIRLVWVLLLSRRLTLSALLQLGSGFPPLAMTAGVVGIRSPVVVSQISRTVGSSLWFEEVGTNTFLLSMLLYIYMHSVW